MTIKHGMIPQGERTMSHLPCITTLQRQEQKTMPPPSARNLTIIYTEKLYFILNNTYIL